MCLFLGMHGTPVLVPVNNMIAISTYLVHLSPIVWDAGARGGDRSVVLREVGKPPVLFRGAPPATSKNIANCIMPSPTGLSTEADILSSHFPFFNTFELPHSWLPPQRVVGT